MLKLQMNTLEQNQCHSLLQAVNLMHISNGALRIYGLEKSNSNHKLHHIFKASNNPDGMTDSNDISVFRGHKLI